jgi:hypothetical protein
MGMGMGRLFLDREKMHDDLRLLRMANKRRWDIDDDMREVIISRLRAVVETGNDDIALKAIAEIRHMESQNQKDEHLEANEFRTRLLEYAARRGIAIGGIASGSGSSQGDGLAIGADEE